ncbi:MAG: NADAR family protein [Bacteroidota bacterium]
MKYSQDWLKKELTEKKEIDYLFFWGHQPSKDGSIIKTCMSQWWLANFEENGIVYKTAEHYMMAGKARLFNDMEIAEKIIGKTSPKDVKDLGRQIKNFDAAVWDEHKYNIVEQGNYLKFSQHENLKSFLLQTKSKVLVEASPVDPIWGIGLAEDNNDSKNPSMWKGENLLGFALMEVRDKLNNNE